MPPGLPAMTPGGEPPVPRAPIGLRRPPAPADHSAACSTAGDPAGESAAEPGAGRPRGNMPHGEASRGNPGKSDEPVAPLSHGTEPAALFPSLPASPGLPPAVATERLPPSSSGRARKPVAIFDPSNEVLPPQHAHTVRPRENVPSASASKVREGAVLGLSSNRNAMVHPRRHPDRPTWVEVCDPPPHPIYITVVPPLHCTQYTHPPHPPQRPPPRRTATAQPCTPLRRLSARRWSR